MGKLKKLMGFARLSPVERKRIAQLGGKQSQSMGKAYKFTSEKARAASLSRKNVRIQQGEPEIRK